MARILLVEDEAHVREIVIELLRDMEHEPIGVATIGDALPLLQNEEWHAVLADLQLPDGDGRKLCREAHALKVPCGLMTGQMEILDELLAAGIPFLQKPFSTIKLATFLRPLLSYPSA